MTSLLFLIFSLRLASAATHSLEYLLTGVTPGTSCPEFTAVGQMDGLQVGYYNSSSRKVILKEEWLKDSKDEVHWIVINQYANKYQDIFKVGLSTAMQLFRHTGGIHTWQWLYGCELNDDGTKRGYSQYGYDGEDFLSLDLNTLTWTAANDKAEIIKHEWDITPLARVQKSDLENLCFAWLKKYWGIGRKVPPEVSLFQKDSSSPVVCHATGFFPKSVKIYWQKNGEDLKEDVKIRETLPNQDGTFQKRSILTVSPEELNKHSYTCIVQHSSLEKEMVLQVSDHINHGAGLVIGIIIGAVVIVLLISSIGGFVWMNKKKKKKNKKNKKTSEEDKHLQTLKTY